MNVLMVGVDSKRVGGMWTVAETYINNKEYNKEVNLKYISTSTNGSKLKRLIIMFCGYFKILFCLVVNKVDLVHIHMAEKGSTFRKGKVAKWGKIANKKVIIHLHAGPFMSWYLTLSNKKKKKIRKIFSYADKVFVLGNYWKEELSSLIDKNKITVVYNGTECPEKNQYNIKGKNIVYFGVMNKQKGIYDLLQAIKNINLIMDNEIKVLLCGIDLIGDVQAVINKYGLSERVKMLGWVNKEQRINIFKNAMINVLPSYYEGLSMTIIEAMSYGIPVITTNISTMPELLGRKGYMYEPGNIDELGKYIFKLTKSVQDRMEISQVEYSRVKKNFSTQGFINNTLCEYKKLLLEK